MQWAKSSAARRSVTLTLRQERCASVEHVLHARDILGVDLGDAPHVLAPGLEIVVCQASAHRLARQFLVIGQLDELTGQQFQGPAGTARRRTGTGGGHQQGFFLARQLALRACAWLFAERRLQTHLHEAALGAIDSGAADHHRRGNGLVTQARVDGEQDLRPLELASRLLAACQHRCEFIAFGLVEIDTIA